MDNNKAQISSDLIRGHIDTIILNSLILGDKFAQQISDFVKEKTSGRYELNQATLYSSLKRLENLKYISGYWQDSEVGRRRFFKITDLGSQFVKENIQNWSESKVIIETLISDKPLPSTPVIVVKSDKKSKIDQETVSHEVKEEILTEKPQEIAPNDAKPENNEKIASEDNYRNVLSGLISIPSDKNEENNVEYLSDNVDFDKIKDVNVNLNGFEDEKDYKYRFSNSNYKKKNGELFINKIRFFSGLSAYLLFLLEILLFTFIFKDIEIFKSVLIYVCIGVFTLPLIWFTVNYIISPKKTAKSINKDSILIAGIVLFNLILITFALNLLFNTDFYEYSSLISKFVTPCLLYFNIVFYALFRFLFSKSKSFSVKKQ